MSDVLNFDRMLMDLEVSLRGERLAMGRAIAEGLKLLTESADGSGKKAELSLKIVLEPQDDTDQMALTAALALKLPEPSAKGLPVYAGEFGQLLLFPVERQKTAKGGAR